MDQFNSLHADQLRARDDVDDAAVAAMGAHLAYFEEFFDEHVAASGACSAASGR